MIKKLSLWKIDLAITVNEDIAALLSRIDKLTYQVIRNFPEKSFLKGRVPSEENILIYQGAVNEGRCIELYIESMEYLPDHQLWIIGSGDLDQKIKQLIEKSPARHRIDFKGAIDPSSLRQLTLRASLGLNLLVPQSTSYYYSLANKFFDYVQAGIPSLNSDFPAYKRYLSIHKTGELVSNLSPQTIASTILKMNQVENKELYSDAITTGASKWVWEEEEKRLFSIFQDLIKEDN